MKLLSGILLVVVALNIAAAATGNRQVTSNDLSPSAQTSMKLGNHTVIIEYNAPSARGRKIEGGLIPYDNWYRLGADAATTLTSDTDLMIGDLGVPKGAHTLFLYATKDNWKLIVNKQTGQWGLDYNAAQDLGRVPMTVTHLSSPVEKFRITLKSTGPNAGVLDVEWGTSKAEVPVKVPAQGGDAVLFQYLFWLYSHSAVG